LGRLRVGGRLTVGSRSNRAYEFDAFPNDAGSAGLAPDLLFGTWDRRPFTTGSDFLVALLANTAN
jgi:hypothetical protein